MARKKKAATDSSPTRREMGWGGFLNLSLSADEKAKYEVWQEGNQREVQLSLHELLGEGFKFGVSYDPDDDCYLMSFTNTPRTDVGLLDRYVLTARAETFDRTLALLVFKHLVVLEGDWGRYDVRTTQARRFG